MGFSTGLAVPLFLFVASITCDKSLGQYGPWSGPQAYSVNGGTGFNDGMMYSGGGGDRSMGYGGSSAGAAAYGGGRRGMAFGGTSASAGGGGFSGGAADAGANRGAGGFSAASVSNGAREFDGGAVGNGFGGFGAGPGGFAAGPGGFAAGAVGSGTGGFEVSGAGNGIQEFDVAPVANFTPGFGGVAADNGVGGFVGGQGNAAPAATALGPAGYDGSTGGALPPGAVRNGAWKSGRGRQRKIKPTFLSGGFSLKKSLAYVKNAFTSSYFKLSLPDSQKRVAKCSGLFKSAGFSLGSMYQAYFALYNDISASHGEMSFLEVGTLAFMEMAFGIVKFLKSTPFACLMNIVGSFDYLSLMYSLLSLMGCDSLFVAKWTTYMYSVFA